LNDLSETKKEAEKDRVKYTQAIELLERDKEDIESIIREAEK
jgi:hypothetical protein